MRKPQKAGHSGLIKKMGKDNNWQEVLGQGGLHFGPTDQQDYKKISGAYKLRCENILHINFTYF